MYYDTSTGEMKLNTGNGYISVQGVKGPKGPQGPPGSQSRPQQNYNLKILDDQQGHCMIADMDVRGSTIDEASELAKLFVQWCNDNEVPWHGTHYKYSSRYLCSIAHFDETDLLQLKMRWS
jgi:hypothetical protein